MAHAPRRAPADHLSPPCSAELGDRPTSLSGIATETSTAPARKLARRLRKKQREADDIAERQVFEPHKVGLPPFGPYFRNLWRRREFAWAMARTDMRAQHLDTNFGRLWLVLNPLLLAFVYFLLVEILRRGHHRPPHSLQHLIAGIFAFSYMAGTIREGARTVTAGGGLVLNTAFPRILLPLSTALGQFMRFLPTMLVYAIIHVATGLPIGPELLLIIPLVVLLTMIASGLAMFTSALQVYFRDLKQFLPYILRIWLYLSPVLYYANQAPHAYRPFVIYANPVGALLTCWSKILMFGQVPGLNLFLAATGWAVGLLIVGGLFFMSRERDFAVRL
ncbi:MAG: teichoic acid transport system permease protein [Thermoleophilaceae bacterium]|nr:teichoic acid transport system permease protein [Thermoleophilaceae bacterium]